MLFPYSIRHIQGLRFSFTTMGAKYHKIRKHAMQDVRTSVYRRRPAPSSNGADAKPASTSKIFIYPFAIKSLDVIS